MTKPTQHGFMNVNSYLTNLIFYENLTHLADRGKAVHVDYLNYRKSFDTLSQHSSGENGCLNGCIVHWVTIGWMAVPKGSLWTELNLIAGWSQALQFSVLRINSV